MKENINDKIPSIEECYKLMANHSMLPNIVDHSRQVMRVSVAIIENLKSHVTVNANLVIASALLHDIAKTKSLLTKEPHDTSGGELLRELGCTCVAEIVEQHVILTNVNLLGKLEEREIVYYADKRVMHDNIVTVEERVHDLIQRYGNGERIRNQILRNKRMIIAIENKIAGFMATDIHLAIQGIAAG
jgi:uncharacterized protein